MYAFFGGLMSAALSLTRNVLCLCADLRLRRNRRMAGLMTTIPTTLLSAATAGSYFMTLEVDPSQTIAGVRGAFPPILAQVRKARQQRLLNQHLGARNEQLTHC